MPEAHDKLAKILRTRPEVLLDLETKMEKLTGKKGVISKVAEENEFLVRRTLDDLGLKEERRNAKNAYSSLITGLKRMDGNLYEFLGKPDLAKMSETCGKLCETAVALNKPKKGFFIKKQKAIELLEKFPPQNLLAHFGCKTVGELLEKRDFASVFSALRFAQDAEWMHKFFDEAYGGLTADDFEERDVELKVLEPEWLKVAEKFLEKKYHNVSHLKELGIIFIIPLPIDTAGETMRMFGLILHYLNEVPFYSKLFRKFSEDADFIDKLKSLLRSDVPRGELPAGKNISIRIVQSYLAKDDENDPRLFESHINPEAEHWFKAEENLGGLSSMIDVKGGLAFGFWQGLDFVGDFFKDGMGEDETLISFDLIDLAMSLVKKGEIKYLYHQQEALWNKIFIEYLGRERVNNLIEQNIIQGYIKL